MSLFCKCVNLYKLPEFPETMWVADILRQEILNLYITNIEYTDLFPNRNTVLDKDEVEAQLPLRIKEVSARSKRIVVICDNPEGDEHGLIWFFAMTGYLSFKERTHTQMIITFSSKGKDNQLVEEKKLYYGDPRRFGFVKHITEADELRAIFKNLGPDFFVDKVTLEQFTKVMKNNRLKNKKIADFLLSQQHYSFCGNYLRADILYFAKISPHRQLSDFNDDEIATLYESIKIVSLEAYAKHGLTLHDFRDCYGNDGKYEARVYGLKKDRKGRKVTAEKWGPEPAEGKKDGRRTVWWVKDVQK